jgi:hypothetical protein
MLSLSLLLFLLLNLLLFFITTRFTRLLQSIFFRLFSNETTTLNLLSFFLLPGTVIHELSHMLVAELLFVKTGRFSFKPEIDEDNQVKIGSLKMVSADPIRRTIIGLAPLVSGLTIIGLVGNFYLFPTILGPRPTSLGLEQLLILLAIFYLLFTLSLTMFPSTKDLEPIIFPLVLLIIIVLFFRLTGINLTFSQGFLTTTDKIITILNKSLALVLGLDFVLFLFLSALTNLVHLKKR